MGILLFKLRHVPDDEAADVRQLLEEHGIEFYETSAGIWGVSMPAIWLHDESMLRQARTLLDSYQQQRQQQARADYEEQKVQGRQRTVPILIMESPLKFLLLLIAVLFILYISLIPFFDIPDR